jgi:dihydrofolate synthase/folylpolyglutamate synthase
MSYAAAVDQLNSMIPELYQSAGEPRRKFSLDEIRILLAALGNPHSRFASVLIAGTNGKGSTAATLASILTASGMRAGLYTSPHLVRSNERIRLDREEISDDDFARLYFRVHDAARRLVGDGELPQHPSYFEILTAQALLYFAESRVDIAVLEVGLGGRLDATNIVEPLVSVITDISLDHMDWLGNTIGEIAREKAGILRPNGVLITLPQHPEANQSIGEVAVRLNVRGVNAALYMPQFGVADSGAYTVEAMGASIVVDSPLAGAHQHRNVALAIATAVELAVNNGMPITPLSIADGIRQTRWPARMEHIRRAGSRPGSEIEWILDVAHNPAGAWALRASLNPMFSADHSLRVLIFSCLRDKPVMEMAQILFPLFDRVILAPIHSARAASLDDLLAAADATGTPAKVADSVRDAIQFAVELSVSAVGGAPDRAANLPEETGQEDAGRARAVVVVSGSVYLVGEARPMLLAGDWR